ncbi:acyl-CoA dehydrogenase family protein [Hydrocarboniclastica marina]|uniref:Acyl-CoA dehydrogenase n=1 Tax=Hydrocarboniclastica marina TaxID=2259620 RepID=A0A4P7XMD1_9ALTE|nr:acyl-CoA dehydrogenase family protein [Hydrocarboniclastica marina]MAL97327.1 acyl-CoA dehydrogenase [Alteromonadaceae bacterium]QCF27227.1 acyl-CoA dehydrogenase [Hydrocarboniclastica marina]
MAQQTDYFDSTHNQARETARRFIQSQVLPHIEAWEEAGEFPRELYREAGDAGLLGIGFPEALGGSGEGDIFLKIAVSEELMRSTSQGLVAGLGSLDIALPPIVKWGSPALREQVVPAVLRGEKIAALAITEPGGGSDVAALKTRAIREGDSYRLNGSKTFITSGVRADYYTVAVRTGDSGHGGISMLLVERETAGFSVGRKLRKMGWWASDTAELYFEDCQVPAENLIGPENGGFMVIMTNFLNERLMLCVMGYMTAQVALDASLQYCREREAFGRPIGKFQVNRHKLVEMATQVDIAREYTYRCAALIQAGKTPVKEVAMAKNFCAEVAEKVSREAVQLHGGMGYMREAMVERLSRDARLLAIGGGTTEIMKELIAKQMGL